MMPLDQGRLLTYPQKTYNAFLCRVGVFSASQGASV